MLEDFHRAYGLKYVALRYFNAAGAWPEVGLGEFHEPETHLIPLLLRAAQEQSPFSIFGTDWPTPDGTCIRDYLHVRDIAAAHMQALRYVSAGGQSTSFNLGTGHGYSVRQMIAAVEQVCARRVRITECSRRPGDPAALVADPEKAQSSLFWKPQHSSLQEIVASAYEFSCTMPNQNKAIQLQK